MATLRINDSGALHLTGAETTQTDPCTKFGSALWLLYVSPHTSLKLQALATGLLQLHHNLQAAVLQCSARIGPALASVLMPLSSTIQDLTLNETMHSSVENEPSDDGLLRAIQALLALIGKDSRCHSPYWIEHDALNALQPYVHLTRLFGQLVMRSRSHRSEANGEMDVSGFISTPESLQNANSPTPSNNSPTVIIQQKEPITPDTHTPEKESLQSSTSVEKPTDQFITNELSASQIFQALVRRGCQDLTTVVDTSGFSVGVVAGGNFGDIWKGKLNSGTEVAIKVWRMSYLATDNHKILKRLTREIYNWSKAKHPNIHQLLGVIMFQGRVGMVSRWMPNGNLQEYLSKHKNADRYQLCTQVSKGVQHLHAHGMVHGDLKATNILVSSDGAAMLTDFDHSIISNCSLLFSATTQNGGGTLRWMAPELLTDENSRRSKETDIYALGMTLLEILTGTIPYPQCRNDAQVIHKVTKKILPERNTTHFAKDRAGDRIWDFLRKCWEHRPTSRPPAAKAAELFYALSPTKSTSPATLKTDSHTPSPPQKLSTLSRFRPHILLPTIPEENERSPPRKSIEPTRSGATIRSHSSRSELGSTQPRIASKRAFSTDGIRQQDKERSPSIPTRPLNLVSPSKPTNSTRAASQSLTGSAVIKHPVVKKQPDPVNQVKQSSRGVSKSPSSSPVTSSKRLVQPATTTEARNPTKLLTNARPRPSTALRLVTKPVRRSTVSTLPTPLNGGNNKTTLVMPKQRALATNFSYRSALGLTNAGQTSVKLRAGTVSDAETLHKIDVDGLGNSLEDVTARPSIN